MAGPSDDAELLKEAERMRQEAERLKLEFDRRLLLGTERYTMDPLYRARVYQTARVLELDERAVGAVPDSQERWGLCVRLALRAVVCHDEMQEGGILHAL